MMKTTVIQLELDDNLISIRDRMAWQKSERIVLAWPEQGKSDVRPLDLVLLQRHAETLGAYLGLVTREADICAAARNSGIPVFSSTADAENAPWLADLPLRPIRRFPRTNLRAARKDLPEPDVFKLITNPYQRGLIFSLAVLAFVSVVLVFYPSAEVQISLPEQKQSSTIAVTADETATEVQLSGRLPMRKLTLLVEGSGSALPTGSLTQPALRAAGQVLLLNLTDKQVLVSAKTILLTSSNPAIAFETETLVEVPAGKGKTITVPVRAVQAGTSGNVDPGVITLFEGALGSQLGVINQLPTSGGTQVTTSQATAQDRLSLKKRILADLGRQALSTFKNQLPEGDILFPGTIKELRVAKETFGEPGGISGERFTLTLQTDYEINFVSRADLHRLAGLVLNVSMPEGAQVVSEKIDLYPVSAFQVESGMVRWQMRAERNLQPQVNVRRVISLVQGKSVSQAGSILTSAFALNLQPEIKIRPAWWHWLPFLPVRIAVKG